MTRITFLGASGTVTGSKYLLETDRARVLIDCGLFQGWKALRQRNWSPLPVDPGSLDAVILTHAHIDHTGYLPKLCEMGFHGRAYCTGATRDLLEILLPDAGHLQEEAARHANEWGYSKHHPALPLYTLDQAQASLRQLEAVNFHQEFVPAPGLRARFSRAGHILGAACLTLDTGTETITFSGDVGRPVDPVMKAPELLMAADYLVVESTYGDRRHPAESVSEILAAVVREVVAQTGVLVVPAFAVGRAQHLLQLLAELRQTKQISPVPVFLDSPMAIKATELFLRHKDDHRLNDDEVERMYELAEFTRTADESRAIDRRAGPMIVISASGMATGGRILHHLKKFLPDESNTILMVGYQAAGTRGRSLVDGADEIKMFGQYVPVKARVVELRGLSAHADYAEMIDWLKASAIAPKRVFVTHGEPSASDAFRRRLKDTLGWNTAVPEDGATVNLDPRGINHD